MELRPVPATKNAHKLPRSSRPVASSETPDDSIGDMKVLPSPSPTETTGPMRSPVAASSHGEQASPFSPNMDSYGDGLYPLEVSHSASSSCAESWPNGATTDTEGAEQDARSDHSSDRGSVIPKLEPVEDEIFFDNVRTAPLTPSEASIATGAKRSRGRPRKHPINPVPNGQKVTKGRSKTGCITCRRRKKKCDEAKPRCMNCEKNAVVCEGYHEKQVWKSGRDRAAEEQSRRGNNTSAPAPVPLQPMFHGVETAEDAVFWRHYMNHLSNVLTIEAEMRNPFKNILLHLATQYQSLMHSILSVSGAHLDLATPEGRMALLENPTTTQEMLQHRSIHHWNEASSRLRQLWNTLPDQDEPDYQMKLAALYGELLFMVLMTRVMGNPRGEHRMHLHAYQGLKQEKPLEDQEFSVFISGFFQYQLYADGLLWHPDARSAPPAIEPTQAIDSAPCRFSLPGVSDGLFCYMAEINVIRNRVRGKIAAGLDQLGDYTIYSPADEILSALRKWSSPWEAGDIRREVAELYKLALWVYLFRTIFPMIPNVVRRPSNINTNTNAHLVNTMEAPNDRFIATQPTPPQPQRRASTANIIADNVSLPNPSPPTSGPPTRSNSMHEQDDAASRRPPSPPPSRRPSQDTQNVIRMLTAGLAKLQSFGPRDPAQTLLLLPCLILGTSCLEPAQQETVRAAVGAVRGYTGLRSCDRVMELLEEVWRLMEEGDWVAAWDWQETAWRMKIDFLCT